MMYPLENVRVLELANFVAGPMAGRLLADIGADVIKVEKPFDGDPMRSWGATQYSPWFVAHNVGKRSLSLRLGNDEASEIIGRLMPTVDVVIENFRPGVAETLGVGYDQLRNHAPKLVYCSISGAGSIGPYAARPFYDTIGQSLSGLLDLLMNPTDPQPFGPALADTITAVFAAYGIMSALHMRCRTGEGQRIETSMLGSCMTLLGEPLSVLLNSGEVAAAESRRQAAQVFVFRCQDRRLLAVHLSSPTKNWLALLRAIHRLDLENDPRFTTRQDRVRNYPELCDELERQFLTKLRSEWLRALTVEQVPCSPVNNVEEALTDPQVQALDVVRSGEHPVHGTVRWIANPVRWSHQQPLEMQPPPILGEHTDEILAELGYHAEHIESLRSSGII